MSSRAITAASRERHLDDRAVNGLLALALLVMIELEVWLRHSAHGRPEAAVGGVVLCIAVSARRRQPMVALFVGVGAVLATDAWGGGLGRHAVGVIVAAIAAFYGAGAYLRRGPARVALVVGVAGLAADVLVAHTGLAGLAFGALVVAILPWAAGRLMREHAGRERTARTHAEALDADQERRAQAAADVERARIARELHDVIAHSVSVMVIQAAGARTVMDSEPDRAAESLQFVERAGREALAEMRRLLGLLDGRSGAPSLIPQPGLADVPALVSQTAASGLATDLAVVGEPAALPPALDLCAYRILQEALTNAIKHADSPRAQIRMRWLHDALELEVADDGRGGTGAARNVGGGHGIVGMRERAALHGGTVEAGPRRDGGFTVRARLPLGL